MSLRLNHPGAAKIDCADCAKWVYDLNTGERMTFKSGPKRLELPLVRPKGTATPCHSCPKKSPEHAKEIQLTDKSWMVYSHYLQGKSVGLVEFERRDPIVRRHFSILDGIIKARDDRSLANSIACELGSILSVRK